MEGNNPNLIDFEDDDLAIDDDGKEASDKVCIPKTKINLINKILHNIKEANDQLLELMAVFGAEELTARTSQLGEVQYSDDDLVGSKVIEGVFNGEKMIGPDGKQYDVPVNYASKSKLVEGDELKLTITANGSFVYKQTKPIERERLVGNLEQEDDLSYYAVVDDQRWKLLTASVTYFKGQTGDEVIILVPKGTKSKWAAVENIVRQN
ncbi:MAG: hypothetical protein V1865_01045 [bacterium]